MRSPPSDRIDLPVEVEDNACPLKATRSHLSCLIFLTVLACETEHETILTVAFSAESACILAQVLVFTAGEVAQATTSG